MIFSPLEQFNILSIYDLTIANFSNFEVIWAQILILVWYIFCKVPFAILTNVYVGIYTIFKSLWIGAGVDIIVSMCQATTRWVANYFYIVSKLSYQLIVATKIIVLLNIPHIIFDFIHNMLNWVANMFVSDWNVANGGIKIFQVSRPSALLNANLFLISASIGSILTNFYFFIEDILIAIISTVYGFTAGIFFNLIVKDFSYVIFSLNTSTIWLLFGFCIIIFLFSAIIKKFTVFPKNNWQVVTESFYGIVLNIVNENAGPKGLKHFPLIFTTFIIILTCNILGMIPYSFTVTSHAIITFSTALAIFLGINILGVLKNGYHFLSLFFPPGAPLALAPLLVFIELVSYVFRVLSLSIRLFANLMSGHTLLKILSTFAWASVSFWGLFLIPIGIIFLITGLEIAIAFLQAYIFSVLLCIYINDAFNLH